MAVTQIKDAIAALLDTKCTTSSHVTTLTANQMDSDSAAEHLTSLDLQSFISDLKHELATFFIETRAMIQNNHCQH